MPPNRRDWYPDGQTIPVGLLSTYHDGCSSFQVTTTGGNWDAAFIKRMLTYFSDRVIESSSKLVTLRTELEDLIKKRTTNPDELKASLNKVTTELNKLIGTRPLASPRLS